MGNLCSKCLIDVGCVCNLDVNLLCMGCSPSTQIKKAVIKEQTFYNNSYINKNNTKKRKMGYQ